MDDEFIIKLISAEDTYTVRHPILREGRTIESCAMEGDDDDDTIHLGGYIGANLIGVMSFMAKKHTNFNEKSQFQLRGMAILVPFQGKGFGEKLVRFGENLIMKKTENPLIWLNAREKAKEFYLKLDYQIVGSPFNIDPIGQHYLMVKTL